jgi:hypothetical protein
MRPHQIFFVSALLGLLVGCTIMGDSIANETRFEVSVWIQYQEGKTREWILRPGMHAGERRRSLTDAGSRFAKVEVCESAQKQTGSVFRQRPSESARQIR